MATIELLGPEHDIETLIWVSSDTLKPDADITVLMAVLEEGSDEPDCWMGWWDGEQWVDSTSGAPVAGKVSHWSEPKGPRC